MRYLLVTLCIVCWEFVIAQNDPLFTQYMQNRLLINPGYSGAERGLDAVAIARFQNIGLSNRLSTSQSVGVSADLDVIRGGVGLLLTNDLIGLQRTTNLLVSYAYQKRFKKMSLGIGVGVGFVSMGINGGLIITPEGNYNSGIDHKDPNLTASITNSISPDFSAGIYLSDNKFFASAAVNHIYTNQKFKGSSASFVYNHDRNLIISAGYNFSLTPKISLQPSVLLRTNFNSVQMDVSSLLNVHNYFLTGLAVRGYSRTSIDALSIFIGASYKNIRILYSYDISVSYLRSFNSGSHEISVKYYMPFKIKQLEGKYYYNSRYL